jgi:hypothetical protein
MAFYRYEGEEELVFPSLGVTVKNGDEVPAVIVQAPGWSAKGSLPGALPLVQQQVARAQRAERSRCHGRSRGHPPAPRARRTV